MVRGKVKMIGTGCAKKFKRATRKNLAEDYMSIDLSSKDQEFKNKLEMIQANLKKFGIKDNVVATFLISDKDRSEVAGPEILMSEAAALRYFGIIDLEFNGRFREFDLNVILKINGNRIGFLTSDGIIELETGSLRDTLGWLFSTGAGRGKLLNVDLDKISNKLLNVIRTEGTSEETFFGFFSDALRDAFVYPSTALFADTYIAILMPVWRSATRELGKEHLGYEYGY
jgi:hypothetical protein